MAYFQSKKIILLNFGGTCNGIFWSILWPFGLFYGHLLYFVTVVFILLLFGIFFRFGLLHQEKSGNPEFVCRK
jgi:hypothetical protein